jgi:hypothetical protein
MKCSICNGDEMIKGKFGGGYNVVFIPEGQKFVLMKEVYPVEVTVCKNCGSVVNIAVKKLKNEMSDDIPK